MKLYLVQHGEALSKDVDPDRPLSPDGTREVQTMAQHLQAMGIRLNSIYHSGKMRARQTADILAEKLLAEGETAYIDGIEPNDDVIDFLGSMSELDPDTMIVGHLPFMAKMVSFLVTGKEDPSIVSCIPGTVVLLERNEEKLWHLVWMLRPDSIVG